jgi:UMF1 family MFS transporter
MLGLWFLYSDGYSVIASVGALYANSEVRFGFSKSIALSILIILSPLCAAIGNYCWEKIAERWSLSARTVIMCTLFGMAILPVWGLLGFFTTAIGLREGWELFVGIMIYGFNLGAVQSFSRSLFASMTPRHRMSETFAVYEITDKGSSWLGPLVVSALQQGTGNIRWSFLYVLLMVFLPALGLLSVDAATGHKQAIGVELADGFIMPSVSEGDLEMTAAVGGKEDKVAEEEAVGEEAA